MSGDQPAAPAGAAARRPRLQSFHELMRHRVQRILLVSTLYDSFIMSEEGQLQETLLSHFLALNLSHFPDIIRVSSAPEALGMLAEDPGFELVIVSIGTGDFDAAQLARDVRATGRALPIIGLAFTNHDLRDFMEREDARDVERVFLWQGDVRILLAMVKYVEDRLNVAQDTGVYGVPAIIVVEDNIRFYSSFLPAIYTELYEHAQRLLSEDLNLSQKMVRMRARPKVLLADRFEEAWDAFERYEEHVLGVISDFEFPREGRLDPRAGLRLCEAVHRARRDVRLVMQSSVPANEELARGLSASFLLKGSPMLLHDLRKILVERFGFGPFVFRLPDGSAVDEASDLKSLRRRLETVPEESIAYHAERNHFSNWLKARSEFALAERLRPRRASDFESTEQLRRLLIQMIDEAQLERNRSVIADFDRKRFDPETSFARIGAGSLGGKARGVAFANRILREARLDEAFPSVDIHVPPTVVLGTRVFEEFLEYQSIRDFAISSERDDEIVERFLEAPFPRSAVADLWGFLERVRYPLAVRSSSLLEDSLSQPFAGVYDTIMLPNNAPDTETRWLQLSRAIKRVYASMFSQRAKTYLALTSYRLEEEQMAVMIQALVGWARQDRFYPDFAGVARSWNFYPEPGQAQEDGVVAIGLGLGRTVVEGTPSLRFSPRHPRQALGVSSVRDALSSSQRDFWALDLDRRRQRGELVELERYPLEVAEADGALAWIGSTYSPDDDVILEGIARPGVRLVTFAQVLRPGAYPLAELLEQLLARCAAGTGGQVEIEFAGNLAHGDDRPEFALLQMRPLAMAHEGEAVAIGEPDPARVLCRAKKVLGNGRVDGLTDLVVVDQERFQRTRSREAALQIARFDARLRKEGRGYVLIGVGRWGSMDPLLGIPVGWNQIAGARVIVEAGFEDIRVAPSQGTHFFQNLTAGNVGYFTVNPGTDGDVLDWDWLAEQPALEETELVRHVRLADALVCKLSGRTGEGVILKPDGGS